jgi:hypothetical protein
VVLANPMSHTLLDKPRALVALVLALAGFLPTAARASQNTLMPSHPRSVQCIDYRGWPNSLLLSNGLVEAIVVPAIGRVMQLRFAGDKDGPIWENPVLAAWNAAPDPGEWANFGGDKTWPSPQSDWEHIAGRGWPPPTAFDGCSMEAAVEEPSAVTLLSPINPEYGIRVRRHIELAADQPVMTITTTYEKIAGPPVDVAVWVITQLKDPVLVSVPLAAWSGHDAGYVPQSEGLPAGLHVADGFLSLKRDSRQNCKIGMRSATIVWAGATELLRIDSSLVPDGRYPDNGCSAEIYTNADPLAYVELELLGPLARLSAGEKIERVSSYTLAHRTGSDPKAEVSRLLTSGAEAPKRTP